ncbi:sce7726 family protein [Exiguobacterium sp. UBA4551]|uniref:sce7726 family protein n=1 Tax=Exiguobacterium sp. UBA4551 TaxID=1946494 RepID=UPI00257EE980|nr:sce7726 family protein [Exiguobacterium sp. UBA4551]
MGINEAKKYFTKKNLRQEIDNEYFEYDLFETDIKNNYEILKRKYRNEYFFKNVLFNKIVMGKYSLNTTGAFEEVTIKTSKADFVVVNKKKCIVYEIKTDLDNLDRLSQQLLDYSTVFSELYVVTTEKNYYPVYKNLKEIIPYIGIIVLTSNETLSVRKKASIFIENLNHENLFKILRKKEYENILFEVFQKLPNVTQVEYFRESMKWFETIEILMAQELVFEQLRKRVVLTDNAVFKNIPVPIRWLVYLSNLSNADFSKILKK